MDPVPLRDYSVPSPTYHLLVDGAVYDNLGVCNLLASYEARREVNPNLYPHGAILIVVDATVPVGGKARDKPLLHGTENTLIGLDVATSVLLNRASSATLASIVSQEALSTYTTVQLRGLINQIQREGYTEITDNQNRRLVVIHVSLEQVADLDTPKFAAVLNSIETSYNIDPEAVTDLYKAADVLFRKRFNARFKPLLEQIEHPPAQ